MFRQVRQRRRLELDRGRGPPLDDRGELGVGDVRRAAAAAAAAARRFGFRRKRLELNRHLRRGPPRRLRGPKQIDDHHALRVLARLDHPAPARAVRLVEHRVVVPAENAWKP
eukprot:31348-Pelagococcus_subviridis.AAC.9